MNFLTKLKRIKKKSDIALHNACALNEIVTNIIKKEYMLQNSLQSTKMGVAENGKYPDEIIVSLTTYGKRIFDVNITIESLLNQTMPPNKIILWLAEDEFNEKNIPFILKKQAERGVIIDFCKDLKSYKKLIPTLEKYPNSIIITADDDIIYNCNMVENLYLEYLKNKNCIYACRAHFMTFDKNKNLLPYNQWKHNYQQQEESYLVFPTGAGGILYPPNCFHEDILKIDLFTKLAPYADDIWFKTMTLLNNVPCQIIYSQHVYLQDNQDMALFHKNIGQQLNDVQLKQTFDYYNLWNFLKSKI